MANLKLAFRTLLRTPLVTAVAIGSLALGIGANTAIFSLIDRFLFKPLPVPEPNRLVNVIPSEPTLGFQSCGRAGSCQVVLSYPMLRDLEKGQTVLTGLAGQKDVPADLTFRGRSSSGRGVVVSGSYFPVLALRPALGRLFGPADDQFVGGHPLVVLSYHYWANELGRDPSVLEQIITVNGHPMTIIGVAPKGFDGTVLGDRPRVYLPLSMTNVLQSDSDPIDDRRSAWIYAFGRLKPGVTPATAIGQLNSVYQPIIQDVEAPLQQGVTDHMLAAFKAKKLRLEPGRQGQSNLIGETRTPLYLLFAVTAIVLLVACTNVANLLLARAAARGSEMAIRSSLGAARRQLVGQLLIESGILAVMAGVASLFVAQGTLALVVSFLPIELTESVDFSVDGLVLVFAALVSLGTSLLFGLIPALQSTRPDLLAVTKATPGRGSAGRKTVRFRNALVTAQIALSMALLASAALFLRSLTNINRVRLGLRTDSLVTFRIVPEQIGYDSTRSRALFQRVRDELARLPGVTGVTSAGVPLLRDRNFAGDVDVEGFPMTPETDVHAWRNWIGIDYFRTLGVPLVAGREFTIADDAGTPGVAIVNEAFVKKFQLGPNPIGRRLRRGSRFAPDGPSSPSLEIVGVVRDMAYSRVKDKFPPVYYTAARQNPAVGALHFYVRTRGDASELIRAIPKLVANLEPSLPVAELATLPEQIKENVYLDRMITTFSAGFAALATLLAAIGLYGVLAYTIAQRTREIGLRMALGADGQRVRRMVLRQVGWMTLIGGIVGIGAAFAIGRSSQSLLFGIVATDVPSFSGAAVLLTVVALGAGLVPARRASRVDPMEALRAE
jgi:predicted permease